MPSTRPILRATRRLIVAIVGSTVVLIGVCLLVLPGPGLATIVAGLVILSMEFVWAAVALDMIRRSLRHATRRLRSGTSVETGRS